MKKLKREDLDLTFKSKDKLGFIFVKSLILSVILSIMLYIIFTVTKDDFKMLVETALEKPLLFTLMLFPILLILVFTINLGSEEFRISSSEK